MTLTREEWLAKRDAILTNYRIILPTQVAILPWANEVTESLFGQCPPGPEPYVCVFCGLAESALLTEREKRREAHEEVKALRVALEEQRKTITDLQELRADLFKALDDALATVKRAYR
jgi:hypothetical protein